MKESFDFFGVYTPDLNFRLIAPGRPRYPLSGSESETGTNQRRAEQGKECFHCGDSFPVRNYGPITVKPSGSSRQVLVETIFHSDEVNVVNEQHGDRVRVSFDLQPSGHQSGGVHPVLVPAAAFVTLRSSDGTLRSTGAAKTSVGQSQGDEGGSRNRRGVYWGRLVPGH